MTEVRFASGVLNAPQIATPRAGIKDIWNAHMAAGATFCEYDIPYCPTTAVALPSSIVTWDEAKSVYKKRKAQGDMDFHHESYVCFYMDDVKFDGTRGIWHDWKHALEVLRHFSGVITPDFSTYQDFPEAIKIYATYRMRLYGYWLGRQGIAVINNVRWGTPESYHYCFAGIPKKSIVAIGTVGGSPRKLADRQRFVDGLSEMVKTLQPKTIIVYGSAEYECFSQLKESGVEIVSFQSKTAKVFEGRKYM